MNKRQGFTIVEVMVATVILITAILGTSAFFFANRTTINNARLHRIATWSAIEKMEKIKGVNYDDLDSQAEEDPCITIIDVIETEEGVDVEFKHVTVTVEVGDGTTISLETYIADTGR